MKEEENTVINKSEELFIKEAEILIDIKKSEEVIQKLEEGYEISKSDNILATISKYQPTVETSLTEGKYEEEQFVELTSIGIHIYYTTDGSEPTKKSNLYQEPIVLGNGETTIKAVAESEAGTLGEVINFNYSLDLSIMTLPKNDKALLDSLYQLFQNEEYLKIEEMMNSVDYEKLMDETVNLMPYYYDGTSITSNINGIGLKIFSENIAYYGNMIQGEVNGKGIFYRVSEQDRDVYIDYYKGEFKKGKANGNGVLTEILLEDNEEQYTDSIEGEFKDGYQNGKMTLIENFHDNVVTTWVYTAINGIVQADENVIIYEDGGYEMTSTDGEFALTSNTEELDKADFLY